MIIGKMETGFKYILNESQSKTENNQMEKKKTQEEKKKFLVDYRNLKKQPFIVLITTVS